MSLKIRCKSAFASVRIASLLLPVMFPETRYSMRLDGAYALAQGFKKDKVRKAKKALQFDFKFKDGPGEEDEPGDVIQRGMQARPCAFMHSKQSLRRIAPCRAHRRYKQCNCLGHSADVSSAHSRDVRCLRKRLS